MDQDKLQPNILFVFFFIRIGSLAVFINKIQFGHIFGGCRSSASVLKNAGRLKAEILMRSHFPPSCIFGCVKYATA